MTGEKRTETRMRCYNTPIYHSTTLPTVIYNACREGWSDTSNKNIHFEMILDVGIGEKRKETRFLI